MFRDGYEYVLVLSVVCLALAMLGPGRASLDNAAGIAVTGWAGGGIRSAVPYPGRGPSRSYRALAREPGLW